MTVFRSNCFFSVPNLDAGINVIQPASFKSLVLPASRRCEDGRLANGTYPRCGNQDDTRKTDWHTVANAILIAVEQSTGPRIWEHRAMLVCARVSESARFCMCMFAGCWLKGEKVLLNLEERLVVLFPFRFDFLHKSLWGVLGGLHGGVPARI